MGIPTRTTQGLIDRLESLIVSHNNGEFTNYRRPKDDPTDPAAAPLGACCYEIEDYYTYNKTEDVRILAISNTKDSGSIVGTVTTTTPLVVGWITELLNHTYMELSAVITESTRSAFANADIQTNNVKVPGTYGAEVTYTMTNYYDYLYWKWLLSKGVEGTWDDTTQSSIIDKTANTAEDFKNKGQFLEYLVTSGAADRLTVLDNNTTWALIDTSISHIDGYNTCDAAPSVNPLINKSEARSLTNLLSNNIFSITNISSPTAEDYTVELDIELVKDTTYTEKTTVGKTTFIYEHTNTSTPTIGVALQRR